MYTQEQIDKISRQSAVIKYQIDAGLNEDFILFNDLIRSHPVPMTFRALVETMSESMKEHPDEALQIKTVYIYLKHDADQGVFNSYTKVPFDVDVEKFFDNFKFPIDSATIEHYLVTNSMISVLI